MKWIWKKKNVWEIRYMTSDQSFLFIETFILFIFMEEKEYIKKIILELQPRLDRLFENREEFFFFFWRSRRGYRRLFGIRENRSFNEDLFDSEHFTKIFLRQFNRKSLRRGQHVRILQEKKDFFFIEFYFIDQMWELDHCC